MDYSSVVGMVLIWQDLNLAPDAALIEIGKITEFQTKGSIAFGGYTCKQLFRSSIQKRVRFCFIVK